MNINLWIQKNKGIWVESVIVPHFIFAFKKNRIDVAVQQSLLFVVCLYVYLCFFFLKLQNENEEMNVNLENLRNELTNMKDKCNEKDQIIQFYNKEASKFGTLDSNQSPVSPLKTVYILCFLFFCVLLLCALFALFFFIIV